MSLIKGKVLSCKTSREKIQYLTHGALSLPLQKKGKSVSHEMKEEIVLFYENDEISRIMPGKKDYISIGRNMHK